MLRPLVGRFSALEHPELLVGLEPGDDAAVYQLNHELAAVLTIDFFTPIVDDPYDYGAIAAANAMSDVYAMGGAPLLALNICAFPPELPSQLVAEIIRGGADKVAEAGAILAGGHTVDAKEPIYGLAVMGLVKPSQLWTKAGAQPGDWLILTKPLGVGVVTTALKRGCATPEHVREATAQMSRLNRAAARLLSTVPPHACTDVTGFSLLGHALELAEQSGVALEIWSAALPWVAGATEYAACGMFPGGACSNRDAYAHKVRFDDALPETVRMLLFTPETSGGLLASVPSASLDGLRQRFAAAGEPLWVVGQALSGSGIEVVDVVPSR